MCGSPNVMSISAPRVAVTVRRDMYLPPRHSFTMTGRRPVYIVMAVLLLLVVLPALADAGGAILSTAQETGVSPVSAGTGSSSTATAQPGEETADRETTVPGTPVVRVFPATSKTGTAVATTVAPTRAAVREESRAAAESDSGTTRAVGGSVPRPGATPDSTSPVGTGTATNADGTGKAVAREAPKPVRTSVSSTTPTSTRVLSGPTPLMTGDTGPGWGASDSTAPTAEATPRSTVTASRTEAPETTRDDAGLAAGTGSGSRAVRQEAGGSPGGSSLERGWGPGHSSAEIDWSIGTAVALDSDRPGRSGAVTASVSRRIAGAGDQAERGGPNAAISPTPGHLYVARLGAETGEARAGRVQGAGHDGTRGDHRSHGGEGRRGPPALPAPTPVAAPARTGLEPPGPGEAGPGRARKGDLPLSPLMGTDGDVPDPLLLLRFLLFLGYRRIRPGNVLDHPVRRDLSAAVAADPGLDLAGCVAVTGSNRETLRYHLSLLVVSGKLTEETRNGSVRYFPHDPALTPVHRAVLHYCRNPSLAPLLHQVRDTPGISRLEIAARLDLAGPTVTRQVQRLINEGLVEPRRCGRSQRYWLTPPCAAAFAAVEAVETVHAETVRAVDRASA